MYCKKCGTELDETNYCSKCNEYHRDNNESDNELINETENISQTMSGLSIAGFVVSLVGLLIAAIPCGIAGSILSFLGLNDVQKRERKGYGFAITGVIVSIVDIVLGLSLL